MKEKLFIHYLDRKNRQDIDITGYFELVKETDNFIFIKTDKNILRIPLIRVIKIKGGK